MTALTLSDSTPVRARLPAAASHPAVVVTDGDAFAALVADTAKTGVGIGASRPATDQSATDTAHSGRDADIVAGVDAGAGLTGGVFGEGVAMAGGEAGSDHPETASGAELPSAAAPQAALDAPGFLPFQTLTQPEQATVNADGVAAPAPYGPEGLLVMATTDTAGVHAAGSSPGTGTTSAPAHANTRQTFASQPVSTPSTGGPDMPSQDTGEPALISRPGDAAGASVPIADVAIADVTPAAPASVPFAAIPVATMPPVTVPSAGMATPASPSLPVPPEVVAFTVASRVSAGERTIEIRLDPEDLGRVDVRLAIEADDTTRVIVAVERPEALALLLRERGGLERALTEAGLKTSPDGIAFTLRDDGNGQGRQDRTPDGPSRTMPCGADVQDGVAAAAAIVRQGYVARAFARGGLDLSL